MSDLAADVAHWAADAHQVAEVLPWARRSLFDMVCCGVAGSDEPVARSVQTLEGGYGATTFVGTANPRDAALINGTIAHALDYDDTHFAHVGHPSVAVLPAVIAAAEAARVRGDQFERAAATGLEASICLGVWLGAGHYAAGFHQTATAGAFGAAVGASLLLDADVAQALRLASTRAAGLRVQFGSMGKPLNAGFAAATGVEAAMLAKAGATATIGALEAFWSTHAGDGALPDWNTPALFPDISYKFHACCHGLHAALEAFAGMKASDAPLVVETNPRWLSVCALPEPETGLQSKFSYAHVLALAAAGYDTARLDSYSDGLARNANLVAWRKRVSVTADTELSDTSVRLRWGDQVAEFDLATPIAEDVLEAKLLAKGRALVGDSADHLWDGVHASDPVSAVTRFLQDRALSNNSSA